MKKIFLIGVLPIIFFVSGCGEEKIEQPPPLVKIISASEAGKIFSDNYPGVVKGRYESNLSFQTGGKILSREVEPGNFVSAGEILMTIDARDAVQQFNAGEAQVESARTQLNLAKSNLERYEQLSKENAISAATLDQYKTAYDNSVAAYNSAVAQAEQTRNNLNYTQLFANADGVISEINAEVGQVVAAGQKILTLVQTNELEVEINVPENKLSETKIGQPCEITFWAISDKIRGVVREIAPVADSTSRTYRVRISLENPPENLQLGMTAEVILNSTENFSGVYVLPLSAIYQTGEQTQVWIVTEENKTALKNITVENFSGNEVLVKGLSPKDKIISAGVHKLREGQAVRTQ